MAQLKLACLNSKPEYCKKKGGETKIKYLHKACPKTKKSYQKDPLHLPTLHSTQQYKLLNSCCPNEAVIFQCCVESV